MSFKKLNVLFVPTANSGVTFYRMTNFWTAADREGLANMRVLWWQKDQTEVHPWERDILNSDFQWRITKELQEYAMKADVIIFGMLHGSGARPDTPDAAEDYISESLGLFRAIKDMLPNVPILTEIDDNMLSTPEYNPANPLYNPKSELREIAIRQFKESDGLIVSTSYLAEIYSDFNSNINVVPNAIDTVMWNKTKKKSKPGIRIGWAGGGSHNDDLAILKNVIPAITSKHKNVKFVFFHGCPEWLRSIKGVEFHPKYARIDKYPQAIASLDLDIGLAPLVDNAFNRGKSNLRWLEYSALGVPCVASNVRPFAECIRGGIDGLLADGEEEFISCLNRLIENKDIRKKMGVAAKQRIYRDFNVDKVTADYVKILEGMKVRTEPLNRSLEAAGLLQ